MCGIDFTNDQIDAADGRHDPLPHGRVRAGRDDASGSSSSISVPTAATAAADDTEKESDFNAGSTPPFVAGQWVSLDIPLTDFTGMNFGNVAQIVLQSTNIGNVWMDNIYFHK